MAEADRLHAAIFDAVRDIALSKGFGRVTLSEIARHVGISKGGLLYHFRTKDALTRAMIVRSLDGRRWRDLAVGTLIAAASAPSLLSSPAGLSCADVADALAAHLAEELRLA